MIECEVRGEAPCHYVRCPLFVLFTHSKLMKCAIASWTAGTSSLTAGAHLAKSGRLQYNVYQHENDEMLLRLAKRREIEISIV